MSEAEKSALKFNATDMPEADREAYRSALAEANGRIAALARDRVAAINTLAEIERSRSFRLASVLTSPLAFLTGRGRANRWTEIPVEEARALASPVPDPGSSGSPDESNVVALDKHTPKKSALYGSQELKPLDTVRHRPRWGDPFEQAPESDAENPGSQRFYQKNGFAVFRGVFPKDEVRRLADALAGDLLPEDYLAKSHTTFDLAHAHDAGLRLAMDDRLIDPVRTCMGERDLRFLRWSTYQVNHMSFPWHRDNPCREFGIGSDWDESATPYRIAKIILYLDCDRFAFAVYPGSHRSRDVDRAAIPESIDAFHQVHTSHRRAPPDLTNAPALVHVDPGDALIFDQRLMHCGRLVSRNGDSFTKEIFGDKSFVSFIYGANDDHSWQYHSYFNIERDFDIPAPSSEALSALAEKGLLIDRHDTNYYDAHPAARHTAWLPSRDVK